MRVYPAIEKGILLIQLIVSKYIYIILLIRLEEIINPGWGKGVYKNTIMIIGLMTLIYGTYKGVMQKTYKGIIASSSILTLGIILISIRYGLRDEIKGEKVTVLLEKYKELGEMPWEINHAMFIYIINILLLFGIYYGKEKGKSNMGWIAIIGILSMIGVPPLGGFYSKLYLLSPLITRAVDIGLDPDGQLFRTTPEVSKGSEVKKISDISENPIETGLGYNEIWGGRLGLIIIILTSILSFYYYFKILIKGGIIEIKNKAKGKREEEESKQEGNGGMLKGVLTIIILFYGYILPFIFPFF